MVYHATDITDPNDRGCPIGRYPEPAEMQAWKGPVNVGTVNPFRPINTRGIAFAICDDSSTSSCGDALFPASPTSTKTPTITASATRS
jgi:hypothetical protein